MATATLDTINALVSDLQSSSRVAAPGSEEYNTSLTSYFSQQEQSLQPALIVIPQSAQEVAEIVKIIAKHHNSNAAPCFAVRSGGKTPHAGSANIQAGVTIDLSALKSVVPNADGKTVKVGPGAK